MRDFWLNMFYFSDHHEILPAGTLYGEKYDFFIFDFILKDGKTIFCKCY